MSFCDSQGKAPAFKPIGWAGNSQHILKHMHRHRQCKRNHGHASLQNGNARLAAIQPKPLCLAILRGIREQLVQDGVMTVNEVGTVSE